MKLKRTIEVGIMFDGQLTPERMAVITGKIQTPYVQNLVDLVRRRVITAFAIETETVTIAHPPKNGCVLKVQV